MFYPSLLQMHLDVSHILPSASSFLHCSQMHLDVFKEDPEFRQHEEDYAAIKREILGEVRCCLLVCLLCLPVVCTHYRVVILMWGQSWGRCAPFVVCVAGLLR